MSFQPLGYPFEVKTTLPPEAVKAAIRAKKARWFATTDGARGWIAGTFMCLWMSASNSQGPMVFARIEADSFGTRISGRAGSDLNGVVVLMLIGVMCVFSLFKLIQEEQISLKIWAWLGAGMLSILFLLLMAHRDRRDAEPLVEFLQNAVVIK